MVALTRGGPAAFAIGAFGVPSQSDMEFFRNESNSFLNRMGDQQKGWFTTVMENFINPDWQAVARHVQAAQRRLEVFWQQDTIRPLKDLIGLQFAPPVMVRWLMANPNVRQLYHNNLCEGYGENYIDLAPGKKGHDHHDYRMVMHGMETWDIDLDEYVWTNYDETFYDDEKLSVDYLTMIERTDIIESWTVMDKYLEMKDKDPTSRFSAKL